jgi:hypothetical protein
MKWGITTLIRSIDYFAQPVQIFFNGEKKYSTVLGGLVSLIIFCITVALIFNSSTNLFNRTNPLTSMTNTFLRYSPIMNLSDDNHFYAAYLITSDLKVFSDPSYFSIEINQFILERNDNGSQKVSFLDIQKKNCSLYFQTFLDKSFEKEYNHNSLYMGTCFDQKSIIKPIGGNFASDYFSNIRYQVKLCHNSTNIICKPDQEIREKLRGSFFQFYYFDRNVDPEFFENPFVEYFSKYFILLDPQVSKFVDIYFKNVTVHTDDGLIFKTRDSVSSIVYDYYREQFNTTKSDIILDFYLNSSNNFLTYSRIYMKIQDLAATIGGLLKAMTFTGYLLTIIFNDHERYEKIFKALFNFKETEETYDNGKKNNNDIFPKNLNLFKNHIKMKVNEIYKHDSNFGSQNILNFFNQSNLLKRNSKNNISFINMNKKNSGSHTPNFQAELNSEILQYKNQFKREFRLNPLQVCKMYFCFCCIKKEKQTFNLFKIAFDKITQYLDYLEIIKTLQKFHRLKKILFNKKQEDLFSFTNKPTISEKNTLKRKMTLFQKINDNSEEDYLSLFNSFIVAKEKQSYNKTYKRLIDNMDEDVKCIFEKYVNFANEEGRKFEEDKQQD